jgi:hypothetical protein
MLSRNPLKDKVVKGEKMEVLASSQTLMANVGGKEKTKGCT